jgi:hypothetical protein
MGHFIHQAERFDHRRDGKQFGFEYYLQARNDGDSYVQFQIQHHKSDVLDHAAVIPTIEMFDKKAALRRAAFLSV